MTVLLHCIHTPHELQLLHHTLHGHRTYYDLIYDSMLLIGIASNLLDRRFAVELVILGDE